MEEKNNKENSDFGVPEGYFQRSASSIREKIEWQEEHREFKTLVNIKGRAGFIVPAGYFEINGSMVENTPYQALSSIIKQNSFIVPANYFNKNAKAVKSLLNGKQNARVFSLFTVRVSLAAAIMAFVIGVWIYTVYFNGTGKDCGTIACIDKNDLLKSKSIETLDNEELYEVVDPGKLERILQGKEIKKNTDTNSISMEDIMDQI